MDTISYKSTTRACYIGNLIQAVVINMTAILFVPLKTIYNLSYYHLGLLVLINFTFQVAMDILCSNFIDKFGFRFFAVTGHIVCVIGFAIFAAAPFLFPNNVFLGLAIGTAIFSASGGILELILTPIIHAIPTKEKGKALAMMYSFYAWGQIFVILVTTLLIFLFPLFWQLSILLFMIIQIFNIFLFLKVPMGKAVLEEHRQKMGSIIFKPFFIICLLSIVFGGASEFIIMQWTSTFLDKGLAVPKLVGDIGGACGFALMFGIGRLLYAKRGNSKTLEKVLIICSIATIVCFLIISLSLNNIVSIVFCAICGLATSLLWPGAVVVTTKRYPLAGSWIFAILAAGGDIGAAIGPFITGVLSDSLATSSFIADLSINLSLSTEQLALRAALLLVTIFPICSLISNIIIKLKKANLE